VRIGFDAKRFFENKTGLGSFSRVLINSLVKDYPQHDYYLYTPIKPSVEHIDKYLDMSNIKIRYPKKTNKNYWRTRGILKELTADKIDIYHGLSNELPFGIHKTDIKTVVTIHDLLFKQFPEDYRLIDRMIYDWKSKYACQKADVTVAISKITREMIIDCFSLSEAKVAVIHQDIDSMFYQAPNPSFQESIIKDHNIPKDYILFVGNDSHRKNLITVIRSLIHLKEKRNLVLVLNRKEVNEKINTIILNHNLNDQIHTLVNIPVHHLKVLYTRAKCLVYPSLGEGWGLPVEEALACNTHALVPNENPFVERPSSGKIFLKDPEDPIEMANKIESISAKNPNNFKSNRIFGNSHAEYHHIYENIQIGISD